MSQVTGVLDKERETSAMNVIKNERLTYFQQVLELAKIGEDTLGDFLKTDELKKAMDEGIICDLYEGSAPFRPRYVLVDFKKLFTDGCKFLELEPPTDLQEACNSLLIMYKNTPAAGSYPVYLGDVDAMLEPFVLKEDREKAKRTLKLFLLHIDKTISDSFVHMDIGPEETVTGNLLVELSEEMQLAVPNITLKYDPEITPDSYAAKVARCMLKVSKPSFCNHQMCMKDWGEDYGVASCLNVLKIGGGGYTLNRIKLHEMSEKADSVDQFLNETLPYYMKLLLEFTDRRIRFIVEESAFFKSNYLVKEGYIDREKFIGMIGVVGVAECVNKLLGIDDPKQGYGNNAEADALAEQICKKMEEIVMAHPGLYCSKVGGHYGLHAQVGISDDMMSNTPGARIPIGAEPEIVSHVMHSTHYHKYFPTGIGDIFTFDETWDRSPEAIVDIVRGAFAKGMRYFSGYSSDSDVVRVTGYLVKKSELAKLDAGQQVLNGATVLGKGQRDGAKALSRRVEATQ